jgi:hypothetical protein
MTLPVSQKTKSMQTVAAVDDLCRSVVLFESRSKSLWKLKTIGRAKMTKTPYSAIRQSFPVNLLRIYRQTMITGCANKTDPNDSLSGFAAFHKFFSRKIYSA